MEFVRAIFQNFFEDTTITINFLKSHICSTSCIEIHALFAIFNNKELRNFNVRATPRRRPLSYRNQSIDLLSKSLDWFLYDNDLRYERVKGIDDG